MKRVAMGWVGLLVLLAGSLSLQAGTARWLRTPAIAPDGASIVFSYQGDLFRVGREGGRATPLTLDEAYDHAPVWSPDGKWLAFASDRHGNFDVYVMPSSGGPARRLTFHSSADVPTDFSPDGRSVIFGASRLDRAENSQFPSGNLPELYSVAVDGAPARQLLSVPAESAQFDASGRRLLFHDRKGYEDRWRKHHRSSIARDLWLHDLDDGSFRRITQHPAEDRNAVFGRADAEIFFLTERSGHFNVARRSLEGDGPVELLTSFERHPVRFLSRADDGTLCFTHHGDLYTLQPGQAPRRLSIEVATDPAGFGPRNVTISSGATEIAVSPNGKELAFIARGEVFVTSLETDVTKRITHTAARERSLSFHPEGRTLIYASERDGSWNLYRADLAQEDEDYFFRATVLEEQPLLQTDTDVFQPRWSPDGEQVAYLEDRTAIRILDVDKKSTRTVMDSSRSFSYADGDQHFRWSPDGKWLLAEFLQPGYWIPEVGLIDVSGDKPMVNLTESGYYDNAPKWAMQGKALVWFSDRDGLNAHAKTGASELDVYAAFLTRDAYETFRLTKEEKELQDEQEEEDDADESEASDDAEDEDKDKPKPKKKRRGKKDESADTAKKKDKKKKELPEVKIEFEGLRERRARLTIHSSRLSDAVLSPDGEKLLYLARFEKGYNLWVTELRTRETKILAPLDSRRGGQLELHPKGKHVIVLAGGRLSKVAIDGGKRSGISYRGDMSLDAAAERKAIFEHAWRQVREKFYDPTLHGADWEALGKDYAALLPYVNNNYDFADLLGELLGELNASHTGARYRPRPEEPDATAALGFFFDPDFPGPGLRIEEVMFGNPIVVGTSKIKDGVVLEKIDGVAVGPDVHLPKLLNRKAGDYVLLSLHDPEADQRWDERVKPFSQGEQRQLLYRRWVEQRRLMTEELSGGKVGYVHVRSMNDSSYRSFQEEVLGRQATKQALVVDTRFNGGGDLVDDLSIFLSGRQYMDFIAPDGRSVGMEPSRRWTKPSIVIAGEGNYSDAHCFPWAYKELGIGKVLGMPVPGTCTFVWWEAQQDPTLVFGVPNMGIHDNADRFLENLQLEPDIQVINRPEEVLQGRDAQLERAVQEMLKTLQ